MSCHEGQPLLHEGPELPVADAAMIILHGRGGTAVDMKSIASQFTSANLAFLLPQAEDGSWYPYSFLVPHQQNRAGIESAMTVLSSLALEAELERIPPDRLFIFGFDQGACLALEFIVRHPKRYGGVIALGGGLFGPPGTTWEGESTLGGTPVFIGCSDVDPQVPRSRVEESAEALRRLGADVVMELYPGMGHTISGAEMEAANALVVRSLER